MPSVTMIEELRQKRAATFDKMTAVSERAGSDVLAGDDQTEFDRLEKEFEQLTTRVNQVEKLEGINTGPPALAGGSDVDEERYLTIESAEYRGAFDEYVRRGTTEMDVEARSTLNIGAPGDGGYTAPEEWKELYEPLLEFGTIRALAEVITTESGNNMHLPYVAADAAAVTVVDEEGDIPDDAEQFDEVLLGAYKYAQIVKASDEFVQDTSIPQLAAFIGRRAGFRIARKQNAHFVGGNGSTAPQGLFSGAVVGKTAADDVTITFEELIDLEYSVITPYRKDGVYIAHDSTMGALRKIKDSENRPLWQPSIQAGQPDTLSGRPILADPDVPTIGASSRVVGFGNVRLAYTIRVAGGVTLKFLDQLYAAKGQVGWRVQERADGKITDANAFKVLATAAS